ncbi:Uncharacterised protein [Vibrio cholerae]|uniref:Uncharacterized protein n=1 Tax=Vibrio cholerae TaxID=666 RepID=A0A655Z6I6_VIBCL|nr:Uncharacterised protein [Vibrio cholerae]
MCLFTGRSDLRACIQKPKTLQQLLRLRKRTARWQIQPSQIARLRAPLREF